MQRAISGWLREQGVDDNDGLDCLSKLLAPTYTIYGCMLLFSAKAFDSAQWERFKSENKIKNAERLYESIAKNLKITHIAINHPIPLKTEPNGEDNIVRAPSNFTPLYGDFGPSKATWPPTQHDLDMAFWVTAKQNGIYQTWAPRWTMFSRGNVSEKARLLQLPSVVNAVETGETSGRGCAAVDLYAGIGYFAFSYLKAGVDRVLCWDLNPWSIEGLRRGAGANRWDYIPGANDEILLEQSISTEARLLVFNESNVFASARISQMRSFLPPVRHVNCGLLPTSKASWAIALDALDPELGGWIHVHENFAVKEINDKADEVRNAFVCLNVLGNREFRLDEIHRLKSYAPGVVHCVLDIYAGPAKHSNSNLA